MISQNSENHQSFVSGEWNGFYLEDHNPNRGWMHLYLEFNEGTIKGEGTDYVGPWVLSGTYDKEKAECLWVKRYMGKHEVKYSGKLGENGITGGWSIAGLISGPFHIWPKKLTHFNEMYMSEDLEREHRGGLSPSTLLDQIPNTDFRV